MAALEGASREHGGASREHGGAAREHGGASREHRGSKVEHRGSIEGALWGSAGAQQREPEMGPLAFDLSCPRCSNYLEAPPAA